MTDEMNTKKVGWHWDAVCELGEDVFATPEEAIEDAKRLLTKERVISVAYAKSVEVKLSDFIEGMIYHLNNSCADRYRYGIFHCSSEEIESFDIALKTAADKWQKDHNLKFTYLKDDESTRKIYLVNPETSVVKVLQ